MRSKLGFSVDYSAEPMVISSGGDDSNALILPAKRRNKRKRINQECEPRKASVISKSQQRKLKKLEEDKEKAMSISKSIEALEKHKLPDDAYSLLQSSQNIGKVESKKEKRRKAVLFSKAGFEVPLTEQPYNKVDRNSVSSESEPELEIAESRKEFYKIDQVQSKIGQKEIQKNTSTSLDSSEGVVCGSRLCMNGNVGVTQSKKDMSSIHDTYLREDTNILSTSGVNADSQSMTMEKVEARPTVNISRKSNDAPRSLITPTIVHVTRPEEVENTRKDLPIVMMEQEIMEAVNDHSTVIICGETGCGKTTQVPQFLLEAGFGSSLSSVRSGIVGVTQPRRVAVLATAKRVAYELGLHLGKEVGFQVRYDKRIGDSCSIKFMTDGILLRELQNDILLKRYSVLILDEAHERSLNTDILIGMLSRVVRAREAIYAAQQEAVSSGKIIRPEDHIFPLKLVLMSATLRVEDFISGRKLFHDPPPVIEVPTRQFPVSIHFSKKTDVVDYIGQAYKKVLAIHKRLPRGGILVFVTGQKEVEYLCRQLRRASGELITKKTKGNIGNGVTEILERKSVEELNMNEINEAFEFHGNSDGHQTDRFSSNDEDLFDDCEDDLDSETDSELETVSDVGDLLYQENPEIGGNVEDVLGEEGGIASLKAAFEALAGKTALNCNSDGKPISVTLDASCNENNPRIEKKSGVKDDSSPGALHVLPLYAMLPAAAQLRVFDDVKEGERLVVVATNVAETSLTIPGIKYVVDTGREKVKNYNSSNGMETYDIQWISKASAAQRAGRAGRTGPGHCYRLYSSAVFNNIFPDFSIAEISRVPVDGVVLLMKSMKIDMVSNFPFPTPPERTALDEAERCLKVLEALDSRGRLTPLGKAMACFPMSPRHSRMLLTVIQIMSKKKSYSRANLVLAYAAAAAAALSLSNPFVRQFEDSHTKSHDSDKDENSSAQEKMKKKKLKDTGKAFREKYANPSSDVLSVAYALQCYELSRRPLEFCNDNALHSKTMEEMSKLRKQLLQLVFNQSTVSGDEGDFSWTLGSLEDVEHAWRVSYDKSPLLLYEEELLGQAICAGWADRVAKRIRGSSGPSDGDRKVHAVRYQACMVEETVFLHRWSSVSNSAPEFLVYSELIQTRRPYMHGVTSVRSEWLADYAWSSCTHSAPLTDPKPYYEPLGDQVVHYVIPYFSRYSWELQPHRMPISDYEFRVSVFAYALLEGQVLPCLKSVHKFMAATPASIFKPKADECDRRVGNLLAKLKMKKIDSCAVLQEVWKENPMELYLEILDWFQKSFHSNFKTLWSHMLSEVFLEPQERFPKASKRVKLRK